MVPWHMCIRVSSAHKYCNPCQSCDVVCGKALATVVILLPSQSEKWECRYPPIKLTPKHYLRKGGGSLGFGTRASTENFPKPKPPSARVLLCRKNDNSSAFRLFYDRGDLPIILSSRNRKRPLHWKVSCFQKLCALL